MCTNLIVLTILALGLLILAIVLAIQFKWIEQGRHQFLILVGSLLGVMILLLSVLFILLR